MILAFVFTLGLTLGAWQAYALGKTRGRDEEYRSVVAFLVTRSNAGDDNAPQSLARRINDGEHRRWMIRDEPRGPRGA